MDIIHFLILQCTSTCKTDVAPSVSISLSVSLWRETFNFLQQGYRMQNSQRETRITISPIHKRDLEPLAATQHSRNSHLHTYMRAFLAPKRIVLSNSALNFLRYRFGIYSIGCRPKRYTYTLEIFPSRRFNPIGRFDRNWILLLCQLLWSRNTNVRTYIHELRKHRDVLLLCLLEMDIGGRTYAWFFCEMCIEKNLLGVHISFGRCMCVFQMQCAMLLQFLFRMSYVWCFLHIQEVSLTGNFLWLVNSDRYEDKKDFYLEDFKKIFFF